MVATMVAAAAVGIPGSALAIGSAPHGSKSTAATAATAATAPASKGPGVSDLPALASSAGITETQLESGLVAAKQAGGDNPSAVTSFARAAGVSRATAQRVVSSVFGAYVGRSLTGPSAPATLAGRLGVSTAAAQVALDQLGALSRSEGVDPASAAFVEIAHHLGVSPARLAANLDVLKQAQRASGE
jgi:hypothetical protein